MTNSTVDTGLIRMINPKVTLDLPNGTIKGSLEYYAGPKALAVFNEDDLGPKQLTVLAAEAPDEHAALASDEVLLRNWTELRGVAQELVKQGVVELTGQEVQVGTFRLHALVARVL